MGRGTSGVEPTLDRSAYAFVYNFLKTQYVNERPIRVHVGLAEDIFSNVDKISHREIDNEHLYRHEIEY